ncbi:sigma-70 family RNA polymerase sigma factor [Paenibacillus eucommiae]|uniref:RNA polymerase sigma-70 factor (ECF subfamily) n=1 Tax=Paenibacillus eucommiae TaxID=1355755 RepID=A0ABS4IV85_9BACL|nr:sigma-70 family RNA polymerase sigma factor [Paenibacillus eucommiae]MBP1991494.1 RNA polymerase sigma-70 factor (ECF subfamily) [Paenibacillus eucommiae]
MKDSDIHPWLIPAIQGEEEAFREVYKLTVDHVYRTSYYLMKNKNEVGDLVSEVYVELIRSLPGYDFNKPFRSWLNGLVIRQVKGWNRKLWRRLRLLGRNRLIPEVEPSKRPDEMAIEAEQKHDILRLVNALSAKLREVIVLRYYQDCSFEEISETLQIPLGTAKSRHHEALRKLRLASELVFEEGGLYDVD